SRVAGEGEPQVVRQDAAAVVHDPDQLDATLFDVDVDPAAAGVHGVFQQLLDDAGRPFDNLPRGDLGDDRRRQLLYPRHSPDPIRSTAPATPSQFDPCHAPASGDPHFLIFRCNDCSLMPSRLAAWSMSPPASSSAWRIVSWSLNS